MTWYRPLLKKSKYGARRMTNDGHSFASKGESACYDMLKLLERAGEIEILKVQCQVLLTEAAIIYKPDFKIFDKKLNREVYVEFKGYETPEWRIKRRLWLHYGPGPLRVYRVRGGRIVLHEELEGKS